MKPPGTKKSSGKEIGMRPEDKSARELYELPDGAGTGSPSAVPASPPQSVAMEERWCLASSSGLMKTEPNIRGACGPNQRR